MGERGDARMRNRDARMRMLVTGGAGFIGSNYVRRALTRYLGEDDALTVLDALTYAGNPANLAPIAEDPRYSFVKGDICDAQMLAKVVPGHDVIVHFAAESHVDRSIDGPSTFVTTNVLGTQQMLQAALDAQVGVFIHVSTDEVYGSIPEGSWDEQCPLLPNSPYSASKAGSDLLARSYARTYGMDVRITRCSNNFGPYQYPEKVIPLFVTNLIDGLKVPLYGAGQNMRDWLHVDDHCDGIQLVLEKGRSGEIYNIGGGTELTNLELTERILAAFGADGSVVERVQDRLGHDLRYSVDIGKAHAELGYSPKRTFEEGLAETIAWYRANEGWWRPLKNG